MITNKKLIHDFLSREEILPLFQYFLEVKNVDSKKAESIIKSLDQVTPDLTIEFMGADVDLIDVDYRPGCDARINCPVEESYPAESPELSYNISTGSESFDQFLIENFEDEIEELAYEAVDLSIEAAREEFFESKADEMRDERMRG